MKKLLAILLAMMMVVSVLPTSALAAGETAEAPSFTTDLNETEVTYTQGETPADLEVAASVTDGGSITYQWFSSTTNSTDDGSVLPGETGTTYTPLTTSIGTTYYYVVATNTLDEATATATSSVACVTVEEFSYYVNFEVNEATYNATIKDDWLSIDADGDGHAWYWKDRYLSWSYDDDESLTPDNYLISPIITVPNSIDKINVAWHIQAEDAEYSADNYAVYAVAAGDTTAGDISAQIPIFEEMLTASAAAKQSRTVYEIDVTGFTGQQIRIVFRHYDCNGDDGTGIKLYDLSVDKFVSPTTPVFSTDLSTDAVSYEVGETAVTPLTVTAGVTDGGTVTYQWYSNTTNSPTGGTSVGTGATYTPPTETVGTTYYYVVATNALGTSTATATSSVACVTVTEATVQVMLTAQDDGVFLFAPQSVSVTSDLAESYGYSDSVNVVSALDVLVRAHEIKYGESFTQATAADYLVISEAGGITKSFGVETMSVGFAVNGISPNDGVYVEQYNGNTGYTIQQAVIQTEDLVEFYFLEDATWMDQYAWFVRYGAMSDSIVAVVDRAENLALHGYYIGFYGCNYSSLAEAAADKGVAIEDAQLALVDPSTGALTDIPGAVTDENGNAVFTFTETGSYLLTAYMPQQAIDDYSASPVILPLAEVTVVLNSAPVITSGAINPIKANVNPDEAYTLDLSTVFEDVDKDPLTYSVSVNGAPAVSAAADYSYTPPGTDETTLVFTASDGRAESAAYTVNLTVGETTPLTFRVSTSTNSVVFYATTGFDADGYDLYDASAPLTATDGGVVGGYHIYTVQIPVAATTVSFRGTDKNGNALGGMSVDVAQADEGVITLRQLEGCVQISSPTPDSGSKPTADQAVFVVRDADNKLASHGSTYVDGSGYTRYRYLLYAGGNAELYMYSAVPDDALSEDFGISNSSTKTVFADTSVLTKYQTLQRLYTYTITTPTGATAQVFNQLRNFNTVEIDEASSTDNGDGTTDHLFRLPGGSSNLSYRVSMSGYITKAGYLSPLSTDGSLTVEWTDGDASPTTRENDIAYAFLASFTEESLLLNVNAQNYLELDTGDTYRLRAYRIWEIIDTITSNIMIEPDFHYNIISGQNVVSIDTITDGNGNATGNWLDITALSEGTAIIEISYNAIDIGGNTANKGVYAASDPNRTALVVIKVGANGSTEIDLGMSSTQVVDAEEFTCDWDAEYDTLYFSGASGKFSFTPSANGGITQVEVLNNPAINGLWMTLTPSEGVYTATIKPGNNIIRVTAGDTVEYQIVRGARLTTVIENVTSPGEDIHTGDTVSVSFNGLYMPIPKFSGIYNPAYGPPHHKMIYTIPEDVTLISTVSNNQYNLQDKNGLRVSADEEGTYTLSNGFIYFTMMGSSDPIGGHRTLTDNGIGANFSAAQTKHVRDILPDVEITVTSAVDSVIGLIDAIGIVTADSADAISAARDAYDLLSDSEKAQVTNYSTLVEAEDAFSRLLAESGATPVFTANIGGQMTTYKVGDAASAMQVSVSVADQGALSYQWYVSSQQSSGYSAVSGAVTGSYTPSTTTPGTRYYKVVVTNTYDGTDYPAESGVEGVIVRPVVGGTDITHTTSYYPTTGLSFNMDGKAIAGYVTVSFEDYAVRTSDPGDMPTPLGVLVSTTRVPYAEGDTIATVTLRLLDALDIEYSHWGTDLPDSDFYLAKILDFYLSDGTLVNSFGETSAGAGSGWMITWNNWFINRGASKFMVEDGDIVRWQYTCQTGADIGCDWTNGSAEITGLSFKNNYGTLSPAFNNNETAYVYTIPSTVSSISLEALQENYWAILTYTSNGETYKPMASIPVSNGTVIRLDCGFAKYYGDDPTDTDYLTITIQVEGEAAVTPGGTADDAIKVTAQPTVTNGTASASVAKDDVDNAIDAAEEAGAGGVKISATTTENVTKSAVTLASGSAADIANAGLGLTVETSTGTLAFDNDALDKIGDAGSGNAVFTLEALNADDLSAANKALVGEHPVFDLGVTVGGTAVTDFGSGTVTVTLPYTPADGEDTSNLTVYYIDDDGNAVKMVGAYYDEGAGMIVFETDHFSVFAVVNENWTNPFSDVQSTDWFYDEVMFVVQRALFNGTSTTTFEPAAKTSRAMLVTVLYRLEGKPAVTETNSFTDVEAEQWYTDAVIWANANDIVDGYGGGIFGTNDAITREQMAKILYNYAVYKGYDVTASDDLTAFSDAEDTSDWAETAMRWAIAEGLINGVTPTTLDPSGNAIRAQVATILMRFVENVIV